MKKATKQASQAKKGSAKAVNPDPSRADPIAIFADVIEWPATLDSGANRTYIPRSVADAVVMAGKAELAPSKFEVNYVAGGGCGCGYIKVPVVIETKKGRIAMNDVLCWVIDDTEMKTVLVGAPELESLGISPMAALDRLIDQQSEDRTYYASAVEMVESGDADLQSEAIVGALDRDKIDEEIRKMEEQVVVNGAPPRFREELSTLLRENRDIFRTQLGPDPPAKVTPMRIHV